MPISVPDSSPRIAADVPDATVQWKPLPGGPETAFMAEGAGFQMVVISPTQDLVAVRLGIDQGVPFPEIKAPFGPMISAFPERRP